MAAILPAIQPSNSQILASTLDSSEPKVVSSLTSKNAPVRENVLRKRLPRYDQRFREKQQQLRSLVPRLTVRQTAEFRNTYKHRLCSEVLEGGYHRTFAELFGLIRTQMENRMQVGPESSLWLQKVLTDEPEKLEMMKKYLIEAEIATLKKQFVRAYECHRVLAQYFQSSGAEYKWLADHFIHNCLVRGSAITEDGGKVSADAHCNMGLSLEESGKYAVARISFQGFYQLTKDKPDWMTADGSMTMHSQACIHLARMFMIIAEQKYAEGDSDASLSCLKQAHQMACEGGDGKQIAETGYCLGVAHERNGDPETALVFLQSYLESCRAIRDSKGIGKACDAIARSCDSCGRPDESIRHLQMFIKISEDIKDDEALSQACRSLGIRYNALGRYDQAASYFEKSYNISRAGSETDSVSEARALLGIAKSHSMLKDYIRHVEDSEWPSVTRMISWKDSRANHFDKPLEAGSAKTVPVNSSNEESGNTKQEIRIIPESKTHDGSKTEANNGE